MCGLFGIIRKKEKDFDYTTFSVLGINNDSRGGDSCGIFIDGKYEYGVGNKLKYFQNFFTESRILKDIKKSTIAVGHCRKASVGAINEKTAQPVVLKDKAGNIKFVVLHNGTIYNYKELAQKYIPKVAIDGLTDSQVMARIFYYKGYDVLSEYIGGSVFVIIDYRVNSPKCLFFKGVSKKTEYAKTVEDERPFYLTFDDDEEEVVFSSISMYLDALKRDQKVYTIEGNHLMSFTAEDGLVDLGLYSRAKVCQTKPYQYSNFQTGKGYASGIGFQTTGVSKSYGGYYDSEGVYHNSTYIVANKNFTYQLKGAPLDGKYNLTNYGRVVPDKDIDRETKTGVTVHTVWFYRGIPLLNKKCWKYITHLEDDCVVRKKKHKSVSEFLVDNCCLIKYLSTEPFVIDDQEQVFVVAEGSQLKKYTGTIQRLGEACERTYKDGAVVRTCWGQAYSKPFNNFQESLKKSDLITLVSKLFVKK